MRKLGMYLAAVVLTGMVVARPTQSQQSYAELQSSRIDEISHMLAGQPSGFGRPCSDRIAWADAGGRLSSFSQEAERYLNTPLPPFDQNAYLQFTQTGDRQPMEHNLSSRTYRLIPLVLAECVEDQGRYLQRIAEEMDSLADMPSWTLSAHDPKLLNLHGERYYVDLNAADMADNLAEALYLLGDKVPAATRNHVMLSMERHVFEPMRESFATASRSANPNGNWWLYGEMNWNAVCLKGVTGAALAVLPGVRDRALFVAGAEHYIQYYEKSFNPDGYDTEGLGYWNYGFSHFIELRENLLRVTGGRIDLLASAKMKKVALFGIEFPMLPGNAAAFGDAGTRPRADAHLIAVIDHVFEIAPTGGSAEERSSNFQHNALPSIALDLFPISGDELPTPPEVSHHDLQTYYADSGVLVSRPGPGQDFAVTIKAGGNTTHSHNDIGSFVIGLDGVQPLGDPGGPGYYTAATFGPNRLDSKLLNSFGHPVPEIDGHLQLDATKVKVKVLSHSFSPREDRIAIDMRPAYDDPQLKSMTRTLVHSRDGNGMVEITDAFDLAKPAVVIESLPTHGTWQKVNDHSLLFTLGGKQVKVSIESPEPAVFTETKVNYNGNSFTRVEAKVTITNTEKLVLRVTPVNP
jgi:hypothetical protein